MGRFTGSKNPSIWKQIKAILDKNDVDPYLGIIILRGLRESDEGGKRIQNADIPELYIPLIRKQQELGWD